MNDNFDVKALEKDKPKKRINSRTKGNTFERKIAKILNERFDTKDFCRTPGSGAFATTHTLPTYLQIHGDLITPINFKYTIECKKGYNKEGLCELFNSKSKLISMIAQARRDSMKVSQSFLLILSQDRKDPLVITDECLERFIEMEQINASFSWGKVSIVTLNDFLSLTDSHFFNEKSL